MGWYEDNSSYKSTYGCLYNWHAVNTGKLCPEGWRMPTDSDWMTLLNFVGGASVAGGKLKETGTTHWTSPNTGATDNYEFTALPGGFHNTTTYVGLQNSAFFWSATEAANPDFGSYFYMNNSSAQVIHYPQGDKEFGFSVRCIKK